MIALREPDLITKDMIGRGVAVITGGRITFDLSDCHASHIALHSSVGAMRDRHARAARFARGEIGFSRALPTSWGGGAHEATSVPTLTRSDWRVTK